MTYSFSYSALPVVMRRSCAMLWSSLLLGMLTQLGERLLWGAALQPQEMARVLAFALIFYGLSAWVVWELARGRSWARLGLSAWFALSLFAWVQQLFGSGMTLSQHVADAAVLLLDGSALAMVWFGSGGRWFAAQRREEKAAPPQAYD